MTEQINLLDKHLKGVNLRITIYFVSGFLSLVGLGTKGYINIMSAIERRETHDEYSDKQIAKHELDIRDLYKAKDKQTKVNYALYTCCHLQFTPDDLP